MKKVLESFLFSNHYLVGSPEALYPDAFETVFSLGNLFGIRIVKGQEMACKRMIKIAGEELGINVPESFYRFFPQSVRNLSPQQALYDQLAEYVRSYGLGITAPAMHPDYEERFARLMIREDAEIKEFSIITPAEALEILTKAVNGFLSSTRPLRADQYRVVLAYLTSNHVYPAHCACKDTAIQLYLDTGDLRFTDFLSLPDIIRCAEILQDRHNKKTVKDVEAILIDRYHSFYLTQWDAVRLWEKAASLQEQETNRYCTVALYLGGKGKDFPQAFRSELPSSEYLLNLLGREDLKGRNPKLTLSIRFEFNGKCPEEEIDEISLICRKRTDELLSFLYQLRDEGIDARHLHLNRREKQIIGRAIDRQLAQGKANLALCCEKRQLWSGLLGHIHYAPKNKQAAEFVQAIWEGTNQSAYARFEDAIQKREIQRAVDVLREEKGSGALLRHFRFIASRCSTLEEVSYVCDHLGAGSLMLLIQLLMHFDEYEQKRSLNRIFRFVHLNKLRVHRETDPERARRKSFLPEELIVELPFMLRRSIQKSAAGKLGKVYLAPEAADLPLPLQEGTGAGGYGVLPRGSVFHLDGRKIVRAFIYWEGARDLNISAMGLTETGGRAKKFNWQTMWGRTGNAVLYSGDQTAGTNGASEYMDADIQALRSSDPDLRYLVFEANVYRTAPGFAAFINEKDEESSDQSNKTKRNSDQITFDDCNCRAGFMQRDRNDSGNVFEPGLVRSNFRITGNSTHSYLFAIDLWEETLIWLNIQVDGEDSTADVSHEFLLPYLKAQRIMNMYDLFCILAKELTDDPMEADVIVSDENIECREDAEIIRSWESDKLLAFMNQRPRDAG